MRKLFCFIIIGLTVGFIHSYEASSQEATLSLTREDLASLSRIWGGKITVFGRGNAGLEVDQAERKTKAEVDARFF